MRIDLTAALDALAKAARKGRGRLGPSISEVGPRVGCLAFDPSGEFLAVGLSEHAPRVLVFELPGGERRTSYRLGHTYDGAYFQADMEDDEADYFGFFATLSCSFSPDGRWFAVQHANPNQGDVIDVNLQIFDRSRGGLALGLGPRDAEGEGRALGVSAYGWVAGGAGVVAASFDGGISAWRLGPRPTVRVVERPSAREVPPVLALSGDATGAHLALVRAGALELRDLLGGEATRRIALGVEPTAGGHVTLEFVRDRVVVAWAEQGVGTTFVVALESGHVERFPLTVRGSRAGGALGAMLIHPSGESVLWEVGGEDGTGRRLVRQPLDGGVARAIRRQSAASNEGPVAVSLDGLHVARAQGAEVVIRRIRPRSAKAGDSPSDGGG
ncbi:hypothetical protein [Chondromyces crocatus]|uniref:Uncharacterized protein n=1 Tax=Chondromyces crocatus TaxID=52 RepID=A0A0K1ESU0_CHOCO|nr:hypothetical protein [Chondromyces crocatus]AKT43678.1 uncharacterized protein CMC5_079130 [Chondromyces crocatus]